MEVPDRHLRAKTGDWAKSAVRECPGSDVVSSVDDDDDDGYYTANDGWKRQAAREPATVAVDDGSVWKQLGWRGEWRRCGRKVKLTQPPASFSTVSFYHISDSKR